MSYNFCFTLNNYTPEEVENLTTLVPSKLKYLAYAKEVAPTTGTPHLQGFLKTLTTSRISAIAKLIPRAHIEKMKGNFTQNAVYCSKADTLIEFGERPTDAGAGEKDRWKKARLAIEENRLADVPDDIYIKYINNIPKIQALARIEPGPISVLENYWYHGKTGTGKSLKAMTHGKFYRKMSNRWWDGYKDEPVVIIDDLGLEESYMGKFITVWTDHNEFRAEIKNSTIVIRPKIFIITSNYTIREIWPDPRVYEPLERRFKQIEIKKTTTQEHL